MAGGPERQYSLEEIGGFLLGEALAIHGIAPVVHAQNQAIIGELQEAGRLAGPSVLGIHLLGSRAHGSSGLGSDIDLSVTRIEATGSLSVVTEHPGAAMQRLRTDAAAAAGMFGIRKAMPQEPAEFMAFIRSHPRASTALHHEGVYDTPSRRLAGLAALAIHAHDVAGGEGIGWRFVCDNYADVFIGEHERTRDKLASRLSVPPLDVYRFITADFMAVRREKFGLPDDLDTFQEQELAWLEANRDAVAEEPWYATYNSVQRLLTKRR